MDWETYIDESAAIRAHQRQLLLGWPEGRPPEQLVMLETKAKPAVIAIDTGLPVPPDDEEKDTYQQEVA